MRSAEGGPLIMKMFSAPVLAVFFLFPAPSAGAEAWFEDRERGWFWYEMPGEKKEISPETAPQAVLRIKKKGEELFAKAVLFPTGKNVREYMEHQKKVFERSERFSRVWSRVLWEKPSLDETVRNPVSAAGALISRNIRRESEDRAMARISKRAKIVFFFSSDCPFCRGQAEVLGTLEERYGIGVVSASVDSKGPAPLYSGFEDGAAQARNLGVESVPALFLFVPDTARIVSVGAGYLTLSEIRRRLLIIAEDVFDGTGDPTPVGPFAATGTQEEGG